MKAPCHGHDGKKQDTPILPLLYHLTHQNAEHPSNSYVGLKAPEALTYLPNVRPSAREEA